jgi:hypothetical protein
MWIGIGPKRRPSFYAFGVIPVHDTMLLRLFAKLG